MWYGDGVTTEHKEDVVFFQPMLLESSQCEGEGSGVQISDVVVQWSSDGVAQALVTNCNLHRRLWKEQTLVMLWQ